jgi:SAM-dependent methyltransferase
MSIEDQARAIFGQRAGLYVTSQTHADPVILDRLVELAQAQPEWRVLDVATGVGHTALAFAPHVAEVVAIDLTPQMLAQAQKLAARRGIENVHFQEADVHELPFDDENFDDEVFDLVTCRRAAHHFSDIRGALSEMVRVLRGPHPEQGRPGGLLLIDDRSIPEDDYVDSVMNRLDWLHDQSHVREYRPSQWRTMLEEADCQVLHVETYTQHRPLSSLTDRVEPANAAKIYDILQGLPPEQREKLALEEIDGELHSNHWYITVLARKGRTALQGTIASEP